MNRKLSLLAIFTLLAPALGAAQTTVTTTTGGTAGTVPVFTSGTNIENSSGNVKIPANLTITGSATVGATTFLDSASYGTLALGCAAAVSQNSELLISKAWNSLATQTCAADLRFLPGGVLQPASVQTLTLTGIIDAQVAQIFDISLGGTVSIPGETVIYPQWFGAMANGSNNDEPAILAASNAATAAHIPLKLPVGSYLLKANGTSCLATSSFGIVGVGYSSELIVDSAVPNTTDVICIGPSAGGAEGAQWRDFSISSNSGSSGRYGINVDGSSGAVKDFIFENLHISPLGAQSLYLNGGVFTATVRNNFLEGCILLNQAGDSLHFENNTITGSCTGIAGSFAFGASAPTFTGNSITSEQGMINLSSAFDPIITGNYLETTSKYAHGTPCISLGSDHTNGVGAPKINGNRIVCSIGTTDNDAISLDYVTNTEIGENNTLNTSGTGVHVRTTSLTSGVAMGANTCSGTVCTVAGAGTGITTLVTQSGSTLALPSGTALSIPGGTLNVGTGSTTVHNTLFGYSYLTYSAIGANSCQDQPVTVSGAVTGGACYASPLGNIGANFGYGGCYISASNTVQARVCSGAGGTPTAVTWTAWVIQ